MTEQQMIESLRCVIVDISVQCERLKSENAALRERLEKAVELREPRITVDHWGGLYEVVHDEVKTVVEAYETQQEAEARLAELKERNNERH